MLSACIYAEIASATETKEGFDLVHLKIIQKCAAKNECGFPWLLLRERIACFFPALYAALQHLGIRISHFHILDRQTGGSMLVGSSTVKNNFLVFFQFRKFGFKLFQ
jgi:hypothetical protein